MTFLQKGRDLRLVLALVAGTAASAAYAPIESSVALFLGWTLYALLFARTESYGSAFLTGLAFGFGWFFFGLHWVLRSIVNFGELPLPLGVAGLVLFALFLALFPALAALLAARWRQTPATFLLAAFPLCHTALEAVRGDLVQFGWLSPAYGTLDTWWSGWAPVGGVDWVNFAFFFCVGTVAYLFRTHSIRGRVVAVTVCSLLLAGGFAAGRYEWSIPTAPTWFRLVQPGLIVTNRPNVAENSGRLDYVTDFVKAPWPEESSGRRATIFSESVVTVPVTSLPQGDMARLQTLAQRAASPVLFTGLRREGRSVYNTAYWMDATGFIAQIDKRRLVPFGEYVPGVLRWLPELFGVYIGDMTPGLVSAPVLRVGDAQLATLICFENLFETLLPDLFTNGANPTHLVVTSNLGWFSEAAKGQHLAISRFRALEAARPILSVNNNGDSAVVDACGNVVMHFPAQGAHVETLEIQGATGVPTPAVRWGILLRVLLYLTALLVLLSFYAGQKAQRANGL